ncbi:hypothetical protein FRC10_004480 [Ceratobasidium sp. 414]|nr:hypothetical protein FRC10_004480 [Ceratobasidium sp. 414]
MLSANPQLESLFIDRGFAAGDFEPTELLVVLLRLRSFALVWRGSPSWTLGIMKMVVGPGIETLYLTCPGLQDEAISKLAKQIANRNTPAETTSPQPLYPALRSLDISGIRHPEGGALEKLGEYPFLLPQLERIRVKGEVPPELGFILSERAQGGFPVKTLEVTKRYLGSTVPQWPESLTLIILPSRLTICYESHDELDEDWEINLSDVGHTADNQDDDDENEDQEDDDYEPDEATYNSGPGDE